MSGCGLPVMGQERVHFGCGAGVEPRDHVGQPCLEVHSVVLAGCGEAGQDRHAGAPIPAADEEPVLSFDAKRPDDVLAGVVVDVQLWVREEAAQLVFPGEGIRGRLGDGRRGRLRGGDLAAEGEVAVHDGRGLQPDAPPLLEQGRLPLPGLRRVPRGPLVRIEHAHHLQRESLGMHLHSPRMLSIRFAIVSARFIPATSDAVYLCPLFEVASTLCFFFQ